VDTNISLNTLKEITPPQHVLAAVLAFMPDVVITVLCIRYRTKREGKQADKEKERDSR